jgi:hypothetical protein
VNLRRKFTIESGGGAVSVPVVRWLALLSLALLASGPDLNAAVGKVVKVLPHLLDRQGRHTLHPSLYERDAYQAYLRRHPDERGGLRFDVRWTAEKVAVEGLTLRVEARGSNDPRPFVRETGLEHRPWYSRWTSLKLDEESYRKLGDLIAWRVTLWQGDTLVAEQKSFLW